IEAVPRLRGEGLLHDFALQVVHGVAVAIHDDAAGRAEDGGAALATIRGQPVAALALPDDGLPARELEAGFLGVGELPVVVEVIAAPDRGDADRCCVPSCTTRWCLRCASTSSSPSRALCPHGFSTYTCFPACMARSAAGVCQWSGAAMTSASTLLSSSARRKSPSPLGALL